MVRMDKSADVLECYGTLDELNAHLGVLLSETSDPVIQSQRILLLNIQKNLFQIGFAISATTSMDTNAVSELESRIDELQSRLPAQTHFILPGGHSLASQTHVCRTVARRAERRLVALMRDYPVPENCLSYVNRLSDYLFTLARAINIHHKVDETTV